MYSFNQCVQRVTKNRRIRPHYNLLYAIPFRNKTPLKLEAFRFLRIHWSRRNLIEARSFQVPQNWVPSPILKLTGKVTLRQSFLFFLFSKILLPFFFLSSYLDPLLLIPILFGKCCFSIQLRISRLMFPILIDPLDCCEILKFLEIKSKRVEWTYFSDWIMKLIGFEETGGFN